MFRSESNQKTMRHDDHQDRLSQLPEPIITQILSYLPEKQICQSSILSKTFLLSWSRRPNLSLYLTDEKQLRKIDATLERYNQERLAITTFKLAASILDNYSLTIASINRWLDIATNNIHLQEIELHIVKSYRIESPYNIPIDIFLVKNLRRLVIVGSGHYNRSVSLNFDVCQFDNQIISGLRSLTTMVFYNMKIESGVLQMLISNCINIETLSVSYLASPGLETIEVHELEKIKKLNIRYCYGLKRVDIKNAPNLESVRVVYSSKVVRTLVSVLGAAKLNDVQIMSM